MYILTRDEHALINTDRVETIYIKEKSCTINVTFPNGAGCNIATYKKLDNCRFALSALHIAISSGDKTFVFPDEEDMEVAKQHRQHIKTKATRHGGGWEIKKVPPMKTELEDIRSLYFIIIGAIHTRVYKLVDWSFVFIA